MSVSHASNNVDEQRAEPAPVVRATLRLFAAARQTAGTGRADVEAATVGGVLDWARRQYGESFAAVAATSRVWCNGEPADASTVLVTGDEVAVLPPVSGGDGPHQAGGPVRIRP